MAIKDKIHSKLETLDMEKGLGIFSDTQYELMPGTRFLIVSYGGTGADALEAVKENVERFAKKDGLDKKIAFLAIDTDIATKTKPVVYREDGVEKTEYVNRFEDSEFLRLDSSAAKNAFKSSAEQIHQWINPRLVEMVNADVSKQYLDGKGASGIRQLGRAMLSSREAYEAFQEKFTTIVKKLTDNNADNLKIFVISGISGGTGSGIVVDATYLIHHFINKIAGGMPQRTEVAGFLLLPPTGTSDKPIDISKGNRNGIAALKEIDHFMTIGNRDEKYEAVLGRELISTKQNIFKACYLLDGGTSMVNYSNSRERANNVVADCILDMISALPVSKDGVDGNTQLVDSFMSDAATFANAMLARTGEELAPREANYIYCALGHGKTLIPLNLMRAYVAKRMFDHMFKLYKQCGDVNERAVLDFVKAAKNISGNLKEGLMRMLDAYFVDTSKGPYYVINLLKGSIGVLDNDYAILQGKSLVLDKQAKLVKLEKLIGVLVDLNNGIFNVYVTVMEEMKRYLDNEHKIICNSELLRNYGGSTYTFCPIDFGGADEKAKAVQTYLDGLVSTKRVNQMAEDLIDEMIQRRKEWTDLSDRSQTGVQEKFDAASRIRTFWRTNLDRMISATIEDYLVKFYSGDPTASYPQEGEPDEKTDRAMKAAAKAIVDEMWGSAGAARPIAELKTSLLTMNNFNGHNMLLIPQAAPNLFRYINAELASRDGSDKLVVAKSLVDDRISCYAHYTGIPAYMFGWVERGEADYEAYLNSDNVGLHISETRHGEQWANFPNLLVESIWPKLPPYKNDREKNICDNARDIFGRAKALGLAIERAAADAVAGSELYFYEMFALPAVYQPARQLIKDVDIEISGTPAHKEAEKKLAEAVELKAEELFKLCEDWAAEETVAPENIYGVLVETLHIQPANKKLSFTNTKLSPLTGPNRPKPENWEETLAAKLLRTVPNFMDDMRASVMVLEKLYEKIAKAQSADTLLREFSHYLVAGLFNIGDEGATWSYWDDQQEEEAVLAELLAIDDVQMQAKLYFVYSEFEKRAESIIGAVQGKYKELIYNEETGKLDNAKLLALRDASKAKALEIKEMREAKNGVASLAFQKLAKDMGYKDADVAAIKEFYKKLQKELELGRMQILANI